MGGVKSRDAFLSFPPPTGVTPLMTDKPMLDGKSTAYVCEGFVRRLPINNYYAFQALLSKPR